MEGISRLLGYGITFFMLGIFLVLPLLLTIGNAFWCFLSFPKGKMRVLRIVAEILTLVLGPIYTALYSMFCNISFDADWWEQLYNQQRHTPLATWAQPTIWALFAVAALGYLVLRLVPLRRMPPLVAVVGIGAMYIGILLAVVWCIQLTGKDFGLAIDDLVLGLYPFNCILLAAERIHVLVVQWRQLEQKEQRVFKNRFLGACNDWLMNSANWPVAGLIAMAPLLGILLLLLMLFGQSPDAAIAAFTQTSDWRLSMQEAPPNLFYDEHYLCTVAAGGHRRLVKPLRRGLRHGHPVIVNRQLCIANAFEQILEEHTPRIHRALRHFYDTYGFPVAKLIRSPFAADVVYILMKPLEWIFLIVIYFCDVKPENRIAVQYLK